MAFVQGTSGHTSAASTSLTLTAFSTGVTTGNTVWGVIATDSNVSITITAQVGGVSCTMLDSVLDSVNGEFTQTFILGNITGNPTSVTFTFSASVDASGIAIEESGCLAAANPVDVHTGQLQTAVTNPTSGNVTTTVANDIIVGANLNDGGTTQSTAGSGFTLRNTDLLLGALPLVTEDGKIQVSPGSVAATFVNAQSQAYSSFVIAIKPAAAASLPAGQQFYNKNIDAIILFQSWTESPQLINNQIIMPQILL